MGCCVVLACVISYLCISICGQGLEQGQGRRRVKAADTLAIINTMEYSHAKNQMHCIDVLLQHFSQIITQIGNID